MTLSPIETTGGETMVEVKTITKIPVGAIALMGALISAVLGLISGVLSAISIAIGVSALQNAVQTLFPLSISARQQASKLESFSVALLAASLAATS